MYDQLYRLGYAPAKLRLFSCFMLFFFFENRKKSSKFFLGQDFGASGVFAGLAGFVESESGVIGFNVYGLPKVGASLYTVLCEHFPSVFKKVAKERSPC